MKSYAWLILVLFYFIHSTTCEITNDDDLFGVDWDGDDDFFDYDFDLSKRIQVTHQLKSGMKQCFFEEIEPGNVEFDVELDSSSEDDSTFVVFSLESKDEPPTHFSLGIESSSLEGSLEVKKKGPVTYCIDNSKNRFDILFWVFIKFPITENSGNTKKLLEEVLTVSNHFVEINRHCVSWLHQTSYYVQHIHSKRRHIIYATVIVCFSILLVSILQVVKLKNLFGNPRTFI